MIRERDIWLVASRGQRHWNGPTVALRSRKPQLKLGEVAIRVTLKIDDALFLPPTINCTIKADDVQPDAVRAEIARVVDVVRDSTTLDVKIFVQGGGA